VCLIVSLSPQNVKQHKVISLFIPPVQMLSQSNNEECAPEEQLFYANCDKGKKKDIWSVFSFVL